MAFYILFWLLVSVLIFVPGFFGAYLMAASTDQIILRWQNLRSKYSTHVLKDEDFGNANGVVLTMRGLGVLLIATSLGSLYLSVVLVL
jgi:hypothetical protein